MLPALPRRGDRVTSRIRAMIAHRRVGPGQRDERNAMRQTSAAALTALIDGYCGAWCEADAERRLAMLAEVLADDAVYTDPTTRVVGVEALATHIGTVLAANPGAKVSRTSRVDAHHDVVRFAWQMTLVDGAALPEGVDFVELTSDGTRLRSITGFFGPLRRA